MDLDYRFPAIKVSKSDTFPESHLSFPEGNKVKISCDSLVEICYEDKESGKNYWGIGIPYVLLSKHSGIEIVKEHKESYALIRCDSGVPLLNSLSFISHCIAELQRFNSFYLVYDEKNKFLHLDLGPFENSSNSFKPSSYFLFEMMLNILITPNENTPSSIQNEYHELLDKHLDTLFNGLFYDPLIDILERKTLGRRLLIEIKEWFFNDFEGKHFLEKYNKTLKEGLKGEKDFLERGSKLMRAFLKDPKIKIIEKYSNFTPAQASSFNFLSQSCNSFLIAFFCILKGKNSTYFSAVASVESIQLRLEMGDLVDELKEDPDEDLDIFFDREYDRLKLEYSVCMDFISFIDGEENDEISLGNLIQYGESKSLEFKATAKFSLRVGEDDKKLYYGIIKGICAMANTEGGVILVGYDEENQSFVGIEKDGFENNDKWENYVRNKLTDKVGNLIGVLVDMEFKSYEDVTCALLHVKRSEEAVMCEDLNSSNKVLFVRTGASTRALDAEEVMHYAKERFN